LCRKGKLLSIESRFSRFSSFDDIFSSQSGTLETVAVHCASSASFFVHYLIKQAGSFIPLHL